MTRPIIRVSEDDDGPYIHGLLAGMGFTIDGLDWSGTAGFWLIAEIGDQIVGCVQLIAGKPVGWLELLAYDQELSDRNRAKVVKGLLEGGMGGLGMFGASAVMGSIPFEHKSYKAIVKKRGFVIVNSGNLIAKRLV